MEPVRIVNKVFSIAEASSFIREECLYTVRLYEVISYSPYVIIGRNIHTRKVVVFRPQQNRKISWV
ncbi:hypothetical protein EFP01_166 [Enterococcus phage EFP01]|uniref:Uncharacterized protein n=1 Tax=Enterococcus phage EFP01 TaxID=1926594 RepID=A0A288TXX8_9CAUD|nr:hypothetical protein HOR47_gp166 [Enterococcus phage EFP01]APZ82093.1 hypothetical protein EFP01_166 [Enterococcus phage EFP01]